MKLKCCDKLLIPKVSFKASIIDIIGLTILLSFFLTIAFGIAYAGSSMFIEEILDGERSYHRDGAGGIFVLFILYKLLPKFINACGFLVNYKLAVKTKCKTCSNTNVIVSLPTNEEPF